MVIDLAPKNFFDLPDFFLHFALELFPSAFIRDVRTIHRLARRFFHSAFDFCRLAFDLVFRAFFHIFCFPSNETSHENPAHQPAFRFGENGKSKLR